MKQSGQFHSLFSQKLDRAVFGTYFLGSVVPTAILAAVLHGGVLPSLGRDGNPELGMVGLLAGVALLSLASFFALRRLVRGVLGRMEDDNARLQAILGASREFAAASHTRAVATTAAGCALALTGARAVWVLLQPARGKPPELCESAGDDPEPLYEAHREAIGEALDSAMAGGRPTFLETSGADGAAAGTIAVVPLTVAHGLRGAFVLMQAGAGTSLEAPVMDALSSLAGFASVAFQSADLQDSQRNFFAHVTDILVAALDAQLDQGDGRVGHSSRIAALSNAVGRELELPEEPLQRLHFGALLHDIGYLKIDRALHVDPEQCRSHPVIGHRMLSRIRLWQDVAPIVLYHHEWFDGSGYPESLHGGEIPLESRIVAVSDVFDKLTHEDFEQPPLDAREALEQIREGAGRRFDPRVVDALAALIDRKELPE